MKQLELGRFLPSSIGHSLSTKRSTIIGLCRTKSKNGGRSRRRSKLAKCGGFPELRNNTQQQILTGRTKVSHPLPRESDVPTTVDALHMNRLQISGCQGFLHGDEGQE